MTTGAEAVEQIAQATGILPATVFRTARILRESGSDLWPMAGKGGGKRAAPIKAKHLTNLLLALCASPITDAPDWVGAVREQIPLDYPGGTRFLPGETFGDSIDAVISELSKGHEYPFGLRRINTHLRRKGENPVEIYAGGEKFDANGMGEYMNCIWMPPLSTFELIDGAYQRISGRTWMATEIQHSSYIPFELFRFAGSLIA